jgi:hypothetical protein
VITRARTLSINCRNKTAMADIPFQLGTKIGDCQS